MGKKPQAVYIDEITRDERRRRTDAPPEWQFPAWWVGAGWVVFALVWAGFLYKVIANG